MTIVANKIVVDVQLKDSVSKEFTRLIDRMGRQADGLHSRFGRLGLGSVFGLAGILTGNFFGATGTL
ncbi:MAG: hypothetical protein IID18_07985 [Nitrospinae bacterium]|nr:hypothetical protein [Nitrospinota bacterium]